MDAAALTNIGLAFQDGIALCQTPTIYPILLILLCGALTGNNMRMLGVTLGFVITHTCFSLSSRVIVETTGIDLDIYRTSAFIGIGLFGLLMLSDYLHRKFNHLVQIFVGVNENKLAFDRNSFFMGLLLGLLVAIAWTPAGNPEINAVMVQTVIRKVTLTSFFTEMAFALGAIVPVLLLAIFCRILIIKYSYPTQKSHFLHKSCGLIIILSTILTAQYYSYSASVFTADKNGGSIYQSTITDKLSKPFPAPEIKGITAWMNTAPLTNNDLHGKITLVYFWTYSCVHCFHGLEHIINWYNDYRDNGLLIIGVHTPEFEFEKNLHNVEQAVNNFKIPFPVAMDNNFVTWQDFHNQNWPTYYLIDKDGNVVYEHVGEADYTIMENNIRYLLGFSTIAEEPIAAESSPLLSAGVTPETHFGSDHVKTYAGLLPLTKDKVQEYAFPPTLTETTWALSGSWSVAANNITAASANAAVKIRFHSKQVFAIMGSHANRKMAVKVLLDGKKVTLGAGMAMTDSTIEVDNPRLYEILSLPKAMSGELELIVPEGLELYTLSFDDQ